MHNVEKCSNISVNTARFSKHVWLFFSIMLERINRIFLWFAQLSKDLCAGIITSLFGYSPALSFYSWLKSYDALLTKIVVMISCVLSNDVQTWHNYHWRPWLWTCLEFSFKHFSLKFGTYVSSVFVASFLKKSLFSKRIFQCLKYL